MSFDAPWDIPCLLKFALTHLQLKLVFDHNHAACRIRLFLHYGSAFMNLKLVHFYHWRVLLPMLDNHEKTFLPDQFHCSVGSYERHSLQTCKHVWQWRLDKRVENLQPTRAIAELVWSNSAGVWRVEAHRSPRSITPSTASNNTGCFFSTLVRHKQKVGDEKVRLNCDSDGTDLDVCYPRERHVGGTGCKCRRSSLLRVAALIWHMNFTIFIPRKRVRKTISLWSF